MFQLLLDRFLERELPTISSAAPLQPSVRALLVPLTKGCVSGVVHGMDGECLSRNFVGTFATCCVARSGCTGSPVLVRNYKLGSCRMLSHFFFPLLHHRDVVAMGGIVGRVCPTFHGKLPIAARTLLVSSAASPRCCCDGRHRRACLSYLSRKAAHCSKNKTCLSLGGCSHSQGRGSCFELFAVRAVFRVRLTAMIFRPCTPRAARGAS